MIGFHDELRIYSKENKLDNRFASITKMNAPVMLINLFKDQLVSDANYFLNCSTSNYRSFFYRRLYSLLMAT